MVAKLALEVHTDLCFRPTFFRLFQRQCEYKLLFVVLSCLSDHDSDYEAS